ncbi:hypothetical protein HYV85_01050 [Candidatus Woesearchaeota archaeon]|nr:hypothetical protein [Candidatus Woesearchaeota archaeon]
MTGSQIIKEDSGQARQVIRIEDLEARTEFHKYWAFSSQVVVDTDEGKMKYAGRAQIELSLYNLGIIRGIPQLERRAVMDHGITQRRKLVSWIPPRYETEDVPLIKERIMWRVGGIDRWAIGYSRMMRMESYFLFSGVTDHDYRKKLMAEAAEKGLVLSSRLLDMVFQPIDESVIKLYIGMRSQMYRLE